MTRLPTVLMLCLTWVAAVCGDEKAPAQVHPDSSNWQDLFSPDLSNAIYPKGVWSVQNGEFTATEDQFLWTKDQYENFVVNLEFKNGPVRNSGVMVYCTDLANPYSHVVEVQNPRRLRREVGGHSEELAMRRNFRPPGGHQATRQERPASGTE